MRRHATVFARVGGGEEWYSEGAAGCNHGCLVVCCLEMPVTGPCWQCFGLLGFVGLLLVIWFGRQGVKGLMIGR